MTLNPYTVIPTVSQIQHKEKGRYLGHGIDVINQRAPDSASSNGTSPTTPFDHGPFTFPNYDNHAQFVGCLSNLSAPHLEDKPSLESPETTMIMDSRPTINDQPSSLETHHVYGDGMDEHTLIPQHTTPYLCHQQPSSELTIIPETASTDYGGDSISTTNKANDNNPTCLPFTNYHNGSSSSIFTRQHEDDCTSIGNSSYSVDCIDFPSPPSSTPSLVPRLKIQTNIQHQQEQMETHSAIDDLPGVPTDRPTSSSVNKAVVSSRFKEIFDLEGTDLEWDYGTNYRQKPFHSAPIDSSSSSKATSSFVSSTLKNDHLYLNNQQQQQQHMYSPHGHSKMIPEFISNIGRSASLASLSPSPSVTSKRISPDTPARSLSTSSGSNNPIRGIMRSLSTTAANHYKQQIPKTTLSNTPIEEDGITTAAQVVATAFDNDTIHTLSNDDASLFTATSMDGRRRKISHLLSNVIKNTPARRHTTKVVNMQPSAATKKLVRRTVIYVNSEGSNNSNNHLDTFTDVMAHYRPHRPAPNPPSPSPPLSQSYSYRYGKRLPPIPPLTRQTPTLSPRSSTSAASSSSSSSFASTPISNQRDNNVSYLEGLELREMEDGTMEWDVIRKDHRTSFFPMMDQHNSRVMDTNDSGDDDDDDEQQIEQRVLALMGLEPDHLEKLSLNGPPPIPRRSPRRKPSIALSKLSTNCHMDPTLPGIINESATDTYYAHDMNLPSLLRLMSETQRHESINNLV
ncbi:hypothetical protein BC941DRAFT_503256 [Chlamydoabsidia padenii]|nr:hypothetical protein BC941DRAFT_503256 [Chlamydoabsidia padenii]